MNPAQRVVQVDETRLQNLAPAEREQLLRQTCRTSSGAREFVERIVFTFDGRAISGRRHQIGAADNHRQQVVEVVGDAAGQLTDGFEPLRLPQLLLEVLLSAAIDEEAGQLQQLTVIVEVAKHMNSGKYRLTVVVSPKSRLTADYPVVRLDVGDQSHPLGRLSIHFDGRGQHGIVNRRESEELGE